jgi:hypothetical protein
MRSRVSAKAAGISSPSLYIGPIPDHRSTQLEDGSREVLMTTTPYVDRLDVRYAQTFRDLRRADQFVDVETATHTSIP